MGPRSCALRSSPVVWATLALLTSGAGYSATGQGVAVPSAETEHVAPVVPSQGGRVAARHSAILPEPQGLRWEWDGADQWNPPGAPSLRPSPFSTTQSPPGAPSLGVATALSTVLPGAGQYYLGQRRAWLYLALEAAGVYLWMDRRSAGADLRDGYRDFAWEEARLQVDPRRDGDFDYYETMSKWQRSGAFDTDPIASGIQPETDPGTFNASIWSLASRLFLGAPGAPDQAAMDRALEYYVERAYPTDQLWDWDMSPDGRERFGELIAESDDRFRQATNVLGVVIANHLVAAIDAFVSARGLGESVELRFAPTAVPAGVRWHAALRVGAR